MPWTSDHQALLEAYAAKFAIPPAPPVNDDACRLWTQRCAEQFAFSFPDEGWGWKAASPSRPPSTDVIATERPFIGYDLIPNQGTAGQSLAENPSPIDLAGQSFIPVIPRDHLGTAVVQPPVPGPVPGPVPTPTPCRFSEERVREMVLSALHEYSRNEVRPYLDRVVREMEEAMTRILRTQGEEAIRREELADMLIKRIATEADRVLNAARCRFRW
jgi:hypothetical protein